MSLSSFEVCLQTIACVTSEYLEKKNGIPMLTNDGLEKLVKEQFPHFQKKETSSGKCKITIPVAACHMNEFYMKNFSGNPASIFSVTLMMQMAIDLLREVFEIGIEV